MMKKTILITMKKAIGYIQPRKYNIVLTEQPPTVPEDIAATATT
jgi:hypothetical protein